MGTNYIRIRDRVTRTGAHLRPTVRVKTAQAALLAVALGTVAGGCVLLIIRAFFHANPIPGVIGALGLAEFVREIRQLTTWWRDGDRARDPIPIPWQVQLPAVFLAGVIWSWAWLVAWGWLRT